MDFVTPRGDVSFVIPDDWWHFAEMATFDRSLSAGYYPPSVAAEQAFETVPLSEIEPPVRTVAGLSFRKYKLMPVLFAFASPECALPLVEVTKQTDAGHTYRYRVVNGYHRYYASVAVGYRELPVLIR
jgi:hypothetical protein